MSKTKMVVQCDTTMKACSSINPSPPIRSPGLVGKPFFAPSKCLIVAFNSLRFSVQICVRFVAADVSAGAECGTFGQEVDSTENG